MRSRRLSIDNDPRRRELGEILARQAGPGGAASGLLGSNPRPLVTVVDQPREDETIGFGLAGPGRFRTMLDAARAENPEAEVVVVTDPSAPLPRQDSYLDLTAAAPSVHVVRDPVEAWSVVEASDRLYVVTSHLGFEAAIAGIPVSCFGMPFYAGWGFTDDRLACARRTRRRTVREVFAAAYLVYSRYFDPYDGQPCSFETALDILDLTVARARENAVPTLCVGFAAWKKRWVNATLGTPGFRPVMTNRSQLGPDDLHGVGRVVAWSSRAPAGVEAACREANAPLVHMEDGFLRSIGLGVALRPGASYVLDGSGIYYDATRPSDLERLLETAAFDAPLLARAARLREAIVRAGLSKYNVGGSALPQLPRDRPVILVAGQVEDDASIKLGMAPPGGNAGLLRRARARHPKAFLIYKPHPDVEAGLRPGSVPASELRRNADIVLRDVSAPAAIAAADRVEVSTSLLGFEALLRGKPVTAQGLPFYAGWGLTEDPGCPRRSRRLTLDELVAGALILYPRYLDPQTSLPCTPEFLVGRLGEAGPRISRRERTIEAFLKGAWSAAFRRVAR